MTRQAKPGEISISIKHQGEARFTAHYAFPASDFTECAFDELRAAARKFTELAAKGRHACSVRHPLGQSSCSNISAIVGLRRRRPNPVKTP